MAKHVDYYYSHISPWTYLGTRKFYDIVKANGATIDFKPVSLGEIFPVSGGLPLPKRAPQRQAYRMFELKRWREYRDIPLTLEPAFFPADDTGAARIAIAAKLDGADIADLSHALLRAVWVEERNIADEATLAEIASNEGFNGNKLLDDSKNPKVQETFEAYTHDAIAQQVFGAPTYLIDGEPFWGQDRLEFVEHALAS